MIGERIRSLRIERNLSLSELAERADIAKSYLSAIERNIQHNPSIQVIEKLANVFELPIQQLLPDETINAFGELDSEWLQLAKEAADSGISKEEFSQFLEYQKWRLQQPK
ncbi:helix-turn-helix domain-containing protein [Ferroacidibacillus organovorans]|uniref:Transcriptional regulator n=1 Tax=Ferroacidibacillus organovorans TaxID=1765683 RepID=A0A162U2Z8_9BACL|nr:helix-turn-helix domain-containing protein [Ferroacidibacillus organovorans]KYP81362.1 transcriptional regulator [Ferroacidibacillus organovorans]OAG95149.1 transcriptional regulator [Ferroacidibacillus organovorans]OPG15140.1 transcriptional regulator [Ferroacidibacillus organovorans]